MYIDIHVVYLDNCLFCSVIRTVSSDAHFHILLERNLFCFVSNLHIMMMLQYWNVSITFFHFATFTIMSIRLLILDTVFCLNNDYCLLNHNYYNHIEILQVLINAINREVLSHPTNSVFVLLLDWELLQCQWLEDYWILPG